MKPAKLNITARLAASFACLSLLVLAMLAAGLHGARGPMIALGAAWIVAAAGMAAWLARSITRPLQQATDIVRKVAAGDLTAAADAGGRDETGRLLGALKDMSAALAATCGAVRSATDTIAGACGQIASGNADLSARTESQAGSLEARSPRPATNRA
ncbi:MAG: HAMP domain-containing protein [Pseudomonadota bacterium]